MTISDIMFTPEQFRAFFTYFKDEPQQAAGVELLRQAIAQSDPALLTDAAEWCEKYREKPPAAAEAHAYLAQPEPEGRRMRTSCG